jgi:hypothetical protein
LVVRHAIIRSVNLGDTRQGYCEHEARETEQVLAIIASRFGDGRPGPQVWRCLECDKIVGTVRPAPRAAHSARAKELEHRYAVTLRWLDLNEGFWMLILENEHGDIVESGVGDDPEGAVLEVYERLIPPA